MSWLLILFGLAIVLSPLMWLKQSPHQRKITELRRLANTAGMQVTLHRRPDAREDEKRLETVCYRLPWLEIDHKQHWVLHRYSERGWDSHCPGWRWTINQANSEWDALLSTVVEHLPQNVDAVMANQLGIGVIWNERGEAEDVDKICTELERLRQKAKEI